MNYFGTFDRSLDEKGRLQLPTKLIGKDNESFTLVKGLDGCMSIYDQEGFQKFMDILNGLDQFDADTRAFLRLTTASICPLKFDSHGRILFSKEILEAYGIEPKGRITIIGALDHFEVWDPAAYMRYSMRNSFQYESLAAKVKRNNG
ncbi:MAG: hypothetical protein II721_08210 [Bacilli bacterium]|nr:hypothetical protein [Bacilli bacterium]